MSINPFNDVDKLPVCVRLGSEWQETYTVEITETVLGQEHRALKHPYPKRKTTVFYTQKRQDLYTAITEFYHKMAGKFIGFRVEAYDDNSTNGMTGEPTAFDQYMTLISTNLYQLTKSYGSGGAKRAIWKPISGTVLAAIAGKPSLPASIDLTTGMVTFPVLTAAISYITKAAQAVVSVSSGHTLQAGMSIYISGVVGMTQINGKRGSILSVTSNTVVTDINTAAFGTYTSGGNYATLPQAGEAVTGGCKFDIPCRFDSELMITPMSENVEYAETNHIDIIELLNP